MINDQFKIVGDSSLEFTDELTSFIESETVALFMTLGDDVYCDDAKLDVANFINKMKEYDGAARSSCPAPETYRASYVSDKHVFCITLSDKVSGSYASAKLGSEGMDNVTVLDSKSASAGEILVAYKLKELIEDGKSKDDIIQTIKTFIDNMRTFFVLENIDNFVKNGRISKVLGKMTSLLNIHPIMGSNDGAIDCFAKVKGSAAAIKTLVSMIGKYCSDTRDKILVITHCENEKTAERVKILAQEAYSFKKIVVQKTRGLSSMYANRGGVIIAF
ncbi:MAG: DegV family protein [Clostridia bacterium]